MLHYFSFEEATCSVKFKQNFRRKDEQIGSNYNLFGGVVRDFMESVPDGIIIAGATADDFFFIIEGIVGDNFRAYGNVCTFTKLSRHGGILKKSLWRRLLVITGAGGDMSKITSNVTILKLNSHAVYIKIGGQN